MGFLASCNPTVAGLVVDFGCVLDTLDGPRTSSSSDSDEVLSSDSSSSRKSKTPGIFLSAATNLSVDAVAAPEDFPADCVLSPREWLLGCDLYGLSVAELEWEE